MPELSQLARETNFDALCGPRRNFRKSLGTLRCYGGRLDNATLIATRYKRCERCNHARATVMIRCCERFSKSLVNGKLNRRSRNCKHAMSRLQMFKLGTRRLLQGDALLGSILRSNGFYLRSVEIQLCLMGTPFE